MSCNTIADCQQCSYDRADMSSIKAVRASTITKTRCNHVLGCLGVTNLILTCCTQMMDVAWTKLTTLQSVNITIIHVYPCRWTDRCTGTAGSSHVFQHCMLTCAHMHVRLHQHTKMWLLLSACKICLRHASADATQPASPHPSRLTYTVCVVSQHLLHTV